jgi:hypothetical protein
MRLSSFFQQLSLEDRVVDAYYPDFKSAFGGTKEDFQKVVLGLAADAKKEGLYDCPLDLGDRMLVENQDALIINSIKAKRDDGVTDSDIRWWWNRHELERRVMNYFDYMPVRLEILRRVNAGEDMYEVMDRVKKTYPVYMDEDSYGDDPAKRTESDKNYMSGVNRPLPKELKNRIAKYLNARLTTKDATESLARDLKESTSVNAFIRRDIAAGII